MMPARDTLQAAVDAYAQLHAAIRQTVADIHAERELQAQIAPPTIQQPTGGNQP